MIDWRPATSQDRETLKSYRCADPRGGFYDPLRRLKDHKEPWADEVQKGLRNWKFRRAGTELWLGFEADELISAGAYSQAFAGTEPKDQFLLEYVSCAYNWRGKRVGDQCLGQLLADISARVGYREGIALTAYVHARNTASRKLFERFGFERNAIVRDKIREGSGKTRLGAQYGVWAGVL